MSYIPAPASADVARFVRDVLERSKYAPRKGQRANVAGAARDSTNELARRVRGNDPGDAELTRRRSIARRQKLDRNDDGTVEANRRLLQRLAYRWRRGERLQTRSFVAVRGLLHCIEEGAGDRCNRIVLNASRVRAWIDSAEDYEWMALPEAKEFADFYVRHRTESGSPDWVLRRIEGFRQRALSEGHENRRVMASIRRFIAPHCAHDRTEGVEPGWSDLTPKERRRAVDTGLELERVWLGSRPAGVRVHRDDADVHQSPWLDWAEVDERLEQLASEPEVVFPGDAPSDPAVARRLPRIRT